MRGALTSWGVPDDGYVNADGSGLSRYNYLAAATVTAVLEREYKDERHRAAFVATLPIAGKDGSLATRMLRTRAEGNAVAKTGSISNVALAVRLRPDARRRDARLLHHRQRLRHPVGDGELDRGSRGRAPGELHAETLITPMVAFERDADHADLKYLHGTRITRISDLHGTRIADPVRDRIGSDLHVDVRGSRSAGASRGLDLHGTRITRTSSGGLQHGARGPQHFVWCPPAIPHPARAPADRRLFLRTSPPSA